jgi:uncharacterized protein (DUF433 family)
MDAPMIAHRRNLYGGQDPAELPVYPLAEAAHFLWVRQSKLGRWALGYSHDNRRQPPVIRLADPNRHLLSFNNLSELHVLSALRDHDVPLQRVRKAVDYLRKEILDEDHPHPLLALDLQTDGLNVFIEHLGALLNISGRRPHQPTLRELFEAHLSRIERDPTTSTVRRLYPFVRPLTMSPIDQPRPVTIDPRVSFGRPVLAGTRIPVQELANRFSAGEPIDSIAEDLDLASTTVEEALRYQLATRAA